MYRREAPKPVRGPGFILPLIGYGCMYLRTVVNSGHSAPRIQFEGIEAAMRLKKPYEHIGPGLGIIMSRYGRRDHLVVFIFLRPKYLFNSEKHMPFVSSAIFVLRSLINPTASNCFCSFFTGFIFFIINSCATSVTIYETDARITTISFSS